ncbi:hypothetical protein LY90DRAFT_664450 [Neocallimastix californiae]|uniref:Nitroreductase n=1 Tax=Neocallimastix californiae TaxID=1754190 RepID=A0A1Y2F9L0_9FUNG|nr:hypothetical protein LY90DRAFT_664450 [Neocallimastix californiae]|eukprot:ORY80579.1 hypothetical protein LY90DRAFT_664450 [Neocallimastix californiae]
MESLKFNELAEKLIQYAIRAPSGHNSQPWKFQISENEIIIVPDLTKHLDVVDTSDKELYISIGCALKNLQVAASHFGYDSDYVYKDKKIFITLNKKEDNVTADDDTLFNAINKRHTHRGKFSGEKIPEEQLQRVENKKNSSMSDNAFKDELVEWMRFNKNHIQETQNGLCYNVLGFPPTPQFLGKKIIKMFLNPSGQNKTDDAVNASTSHFCLFTVKEPTIENYIELGTLLEEYLLKVTSSGLAYSFSNQPCEVLKIYETLKAELKVNDYPGVIIRLGYGKEPSNFSPREKPDIQIL